MARKYRSEILVGVVAGFIGWLLGLAFIEWFRLPPPPIDLLAFTESAFGIGMTVIALIFALVTVNQIKEIDRRFAEISKEIEYTSTQHFRDLQAYFYEMVATEKQSFQEKVQEMQGLLHNAERTVDSSATNYGTAMMAISELQERVKKLEDRRTR